MRILKNHPILKMVNSYIFGILNALSNVSNVYIQLVLTKLYNSWEAIVNKWKIYGYLPFVRRII
jgi:hypothetical protein